MDQLFVWKENGCVHDNNTSESHKLITLNVLWLLLLKTALFTITVPSDLIQRSTTRSTCRYVKNWHISSRDVFRALPESPEKLRLQFLCRVVVRSLYMEKTTCKHNRAKMSTMSSIEDAVFTGLNVLTLRAAGTGKNSLVKKLSQK